LCETAVDASQAALLERKELVNKDYTVIPKLKCKGDRPALLPVVLDAAAKDRAKAARNKQPGGRIYNEIQDLKDKSVKDKTMERQKEDETVPEEDVDEDEPAQLEAEPDFSKGPIAPKYSLVYSYPTSIGDFRNTGDINAPVEKQSPSEIKLKIELPKAESAEDLKVDLKVHGLQLEYRSYYYLSLDFLFEIIVDTAKAKYVSSKKILELTLPVVKRALLPKPTFTPLVESKENSVDEDVNEERKEYQEDSHHNQIPEKEGILEDQKIEKTELDPVQTSISSNGPIQEVFISNTNQESLINDLKQDAVVSRVQRLEVEIILKPQITFLELIHIYLLHLPGYEPSQIDLLIGDDKLLVKYTGQQVTQYLLLKAEGRSSFKNVEIEKQYVRDYFGFRLNFRSIEDAQSAKDCFKLYQEIEASELEDIYTVLQDDRLRREEIQRLAREAAIQELVPEAEITKDDDPNNKPEPDLDQDELIHRQEVADTDENLRSNEVSEVKTENQGPSVEESVKPTVKQYGWQLLDLDIIDYSCELD
jgi:hypothetical protein